MKFCKNCRSHKSYNAFYSDKRLKDGYKSKCKNCYLEKVKNYNAENKNSQVTYHQKYYIENKVSLLERQKKYNKQYQNDRRKTDINYRLAAMLRTTIYRCVKGTIKVASSVRDLGCSIEYFKNYIEQKFQEGMTWKNYGEWHLDHIIPLSKFDLRDRSHFLIACNYTNYQPLWAADNIKKRDKV